MYIHTSSGFVVSESYANNVYPSFLKSPNTIRYIHSDAPLPACNPQFLIEKQLLANSLSLSPCLTCSLGSRELYMYYMYVHIMHYCSVSVHGKCIYSDDMYVCVMVYRGGPNSLGSVVNWSIDPVLWHCVAGCCLGLCYTLDTRNAAAELNGITFLYGPLVRGCWPHTHTLCQ